VRRLALLPLVPLLLLLSGGAATALPGTACPVFPANNVWHADVSTLPVHPRSAAWLASASASSKRLHPDFGPSGDPQVPYGIPYQVVPSSHAKVNVTFDYADESDRVPYPLGPDTPIEGGAGSGGDMHTVVVDSGTCRLYETWYTQHTASGWTAGSGATWSLTSNAMRPAGWTSADAAGLPILPGLLRLDEVQAGHVDHAIRFTVARTDRSYVWPARHQAGAANDANLPPMGARFRLKASYNTAGLRADTRTVLAAMKTYGLLLADNGSDWFFQGSADNNWPTGLLDQLKAVPASAFEAVDESSLMVSPDSAAVRSPKAPRQRAPYVPPRLSPFPAPSPTPRHESPAPVVTATPRRTPRASTPAHSAPAAQPVAEPPTRRRGRLWPFWLLAPPAVIVAASLRWRRALTDFAHSARQTR
jgi:hypothetical protein